VARSQAEENEVLRAILLDILSKWEREEPRSPEGRDAASVNEESGSRDPGMRAAHPTRDVPIFTTTTVIVGPSPGGPVPSRPGLPPTPTPSSPPSPATGDTPLQDTLIIDTSKGPGLLPESGDRALGAGISQGTGGETDELEKTVILRAEGSSFPAGEQGGRTPPPGEEEPGKKKKAGAEGSPAPGEDFLDKTMVLKKRSSPDNKKS